MEIEFVGAARTVTGSMHLVRTARATVLLDCGLYQGRRHETIQRNKHLPLDPKKIDAVVLSHAHIDHSGALPLLMRMGYAGPIFTTPATRDLCAVMLRDAAMIQEADARYINRTIEHDHSDMEPVEPLYDDHDVLRVLEATISVPYHRRLSVAPGITLTLLDAGHVLGSAITVLEVEEDGRTKRVVFTGDLGRRNMPILRDPEIPEGADLLITESTYGDRLHDPIEKMDDDLAEVLKTTYARGGKVIIPSFALERAQEIVFALQTLRSQGRMPPMPVYVDSPLTVKITDIFKLHPECYDEETRQLIANGRSPFDFESLRYVSEVEDSKGLDRSTDPAVIISASGMCEAGRVLHHLRATIESEKNTVLIVGFQAPHTLGRRLVEKRDRRAQVVVLNGFSAHADQADLVHFAEAVRGKGTLERIALVHGDPSAQDVLATMLKGHGFGSVRAPEPGDRITV